MNKTITYEKVLSSIQRKFKIRYPMILEIL